ncbi:uncharacterized protein [Choristoneura fumiferana]|uniref:uncharacterized protein n=1 Tax=Choristoneura fumiferana TaxID=7141 RepID=UPI003D15CFB1
MLVCVLDDYTLYCPGTCPFLLLHSTRTPRYTGCPTCGTTPKSRLLSLHDAFYIMPRTRRNRSLDDDDDTEARHDWSPGHVTAMFETLQRSQMEAFEKLINRVSDSVPRMTSSPSPTFTSALEGRSGDFSRCKQSYSGAPNESLEGFIDAVESYKECAHVSDSSALRGLSMLLTHEAATWWQGVKPQIASWPEAIENLRSAFGDRRPPPKIYRILFSTEQGEQEKTDIFVAKARALLARIPTGDLSEKVQLDMVYSLLHHDIRKRLRREEVVSFSELLHRARQIEDSVDAPKNAAGAPTSRAPRASGNVSAARSTPASPFAPQRSLNSRAAPSAPAPAAPATPSLPRHEFTSSAKSNRQYCVYCKRTGHVRDDCPKLEVKSDVVVSCYGCGAPGVIRSQCTKCNTVSFNAISELSQVISSSVLDCESGKKNITSNLHNKIVNNDDIFTPSGPHVDSATELSSSSLFHCINYNRATTGSMTRSQQVKVIDNENTDNRRKKNVDRNLSMDLPHSLSSINDVSEVCLTSHVENNFIPLCQPLRPIFHVQVLGVNGSALVDTAARQSIAGHTLYAILKAKAYPMTSSLRTVKLADGQVCTRNVMEARNIEVSLRELFACTSSRLHKYSALYALLTF